MKDKPLKENFYQIISESDKQWVLAEERFLLKTYGVHRLQKGVYKKIKNAVPGKKVILKVPFYDILANQKYRNMFEYDSIINETKFKVNFSYVQKLMKKKLFMTEEEKDRNLHHIDCLFKEYTKDQEGEDEELNYRM
jgi:hypothetical protein